jgi:hypothetical protein
MPTITIPNNWKPRPYQMGLWSYLENGGKRGLEIAHRRWGKDDICLHWSCVAAHERVATYWHMLPLANQARKAIWTAINPHTGKRRIDEAFPEELRANTNDQEMFIRFKNGSTWQVLGSDNFNSLVGSPPAGVVFSEFALANPAAWAYLRPIMAENNGWALFITTPRGKNHAYNLLKSAQQDPDWWSEVQTVDETSVFTQEKLDKERQELINLFGQGVGDSLFKQEYYCSFEAAIPGAYYARELNDILVTGRITKVKHDNKYPVNTAWDLGFNDSTAIWWFQVVYGEIRVLNYHESNGQTIPFYTGLLEKVSIENDYIYGTHWLPHDARAKTLASGGKSIIEQMASKIPIEKMKIVPSLSLQDGIQASRMALQRAWFDEEKCEKGIEALRQYQREYDDSKQTFKDHPRHDWTSHGSDAWRMLSIAWSEKAKQVDQEKAIKGLGVGGANTMTINDMWKEVKPQRPTRY